MGLIWRNKEGNDLYWETRSHGIPEADRQATLGALVVIEPEVK